MGVTVNHAFTSPVGDATGTITVLNTNGLTTTANAAQIIKPSNWNDNHIVQIDGYAGTGFSGTNISGTVDSNGISLSVAPGGGAGDGYNIVQLGTVGTTGTAWSSLSATVGINGSQNITVSQNNSNQIVVVGPNLTPYLTTARASNDAIGLNTALTGNGVAWTVNSSGLSLNVPAFLTTAAQVSHSHGNPTLALTNLSGTTASNSNGLTLSLSAAAGGGGADGYNILAAGTQTAGTAATVNFANGNGITFGMSNSSQITASHNGLTTARASNDAVGLNTALTAGPLAWTVNSSGISLNAGSAAGTTSGFGGNSISGSITHNTAGINISLNHPSWLTTAANSTHSHGNPTLNLTNISGTTASNSAGLTLSLSAGAIPTVTQYFSATNTTFNGTNVSGSITLNTNGLRIDLSAPTPGGGAAINVSAGTTSGNLQTIQFNDGNGVTFGLNGSTVTASVNAGGGGGGGGGTQSFWQPVPFNNSTTLAPIGAGTIVVWPAYQDGVASFSRGIVYISNSISSSSNSSHAGNISLFLGLYTLNGSTLSLASSGSQSYQWTNTSNNSFASIASIRGLTVPINASFNGGDIWCAMMSSTSTTNANWFTARHIIVSGMTQQLVGNIGEASNASRQMLPGWGQFSATSSVLPQSMALSNIRGIGSGASNVGITPYINFVNMTA
jgi:hypothetical protein